MRAAVAALGLGLAGLAGGALRTAPAFAVAAFAGTVLHPGIVPEAHRAAQA